MANQIRYQVGFDVNQSGLRQIKSSLQQIQKLKLSDVVKFNKSDANSALDTLKSVQQDARKVEDALNKAFNVKLNTLNIDKFNKELASSNLSIEKIYQSFSQVGSSGQAAFNSLSSQILNTNLQLKQSNKLLDSMATSMANTVKWGITSSIFNNITSSIQNAYYYAKDLDRSLTNIRIVTGDSADQMQRFAQTANNAAKNLGRSTLDYTKASLGFYQQGLAADQVEARTTATLKAQNITQAGTEMVDYLTSVWNGFNVGAEQAELYVDKLAAVADSTASDMGQLATAISKVASTANAMGVDIDQLNGQVATVIATTRQAPESVGVAFKTIYARMNDIKTGADEAEISLGNYSGKMAELGFNVLDASGHLRDTGQVIEEIGGRWQDLTRQQQINLAQTMAGQRQYNNLIALFDNWDKYLQSVNTSIEAQGTLNEKNDRYLESLEAHMQALGTEAERTYDILFDEDTVKGFVDIFDGVLTKFNDFIDMFGSGAGALTNLGLIAANVFNKQITGAIDKTINTFEKKIINIKNAKAIDNALNQIDVNSGREADTYSEQIRLNSEKQSLQIKKKILQLSNSLTESEYRELESLRNKIQQERTLVETIENRQSIAEEVLEIGEATDAQILARIQNEQKSLNIKKQQLVFIDDILLKGSQNVEGQQAIFQLNEQQEEKLREILGSKVEIEQYDRVIQKLIDGQKIDQEDIDLLTKDISKEIKDQSERMVTMKQLKQAVLTVSRGEYDSIQAALEADRQRTAEIEKQAERRQLINNIVSKGTAILQATQALVVSIQQATDKTATGAERANGYWSATTAALSGIANYLHPGAGLLVQGISSVIQSLAKGTDWYQKWEDSLKGIEERVEDIKEKQQQAARLNTDYSKDKKDIEDIADEFEQLRVKAGKYNETISQMSEQQQSRYRSLVQTLIQKNPNLVEGWTRQGDAIIGNNNAIQDTLDLLDKQYQKEMAIVYAKGNLTNSLGALKQAEENKVNANTSLDNAKAQVSVNENDVNRIQINTQAAGQPISGEWAGFLTDAYIQNQSKESSATSISYLLEKYSANNKNINAFHKSFKDSVDTYNNIIQDEESTIEDMEAARTALLDNTKRILDSIGDLYANGTLPKSIKDDISIFNTFMDEVRDFSYKSQEEGKVSISNAEKAIADAEQEYNTVLESVKQNIAQSLKWTPEINKAFDSVRESWGDNFTPQVESLMDGIINNWVYEVADFNKYMDLSPEQAATIISNDFNDFLQNTFVKLDQNIITNVQSQIKNLSNEEISAKEYYERLRILLKDFVNNKDFSKLMAQDYAQNKSYDNSNNLLSVLFGISDPAALVQDSYAELNDLYASIASHVSEDRQETIIGILKNSKYTEQELKDLNNQLNIDNADFGQITSNFMTYIRNFFTQGEEVSDQGSQSIVDNFSKISTAIAKLQNGKSLNYTQQSNLWSALFPDKDFDLTQFNDTNALLQEFKNQVLGLDNSLQRLTGLDLLVNNFKDLNDIKDEISKEDYQQLWQDTYEEQLQAVGADIEAIKEYTALKGQVFDFDSKEGIQSAIAFYKEGQSIDQLGETANTVKDKLKGFKDEYGNLTDDWTNDSDVLDYLSTFDSLLNNLGIDADYQWIVDNIDKIVEALKNGTFNAQTFKQQVEGISSQTPPAEITFDQAWKNNENIKSAYDNLSNRNNLSDEQFNTVLKLISSNEDLNKIYEQQGLNGEHFLEVLKQIGEENQKQLLETRQAELESRRAAAQEKLGSSQRTLALLGDRGADQDAYQRALALKQNQVTGYDIDSEDLENAEKIIKEYEARQQILQRITDGENQLTEIEKQQLALEVLKNSLLEEQVAKQKKLDKDVNKEQWQNLSNQLQNLAPLSEELSDDLVKDKEAADNVSEAILRFDDACKSVAESYEDWIKALQSGSIQQQAEAIAELRDTYGDLLDMDGSSFSQEFLSSADNLDLMRAAIDGDIEAYDELMQLAQQDIAAQLHFDTTDFENGINSLLDDYYNVQSLDDLQIGASLNNQGFLDGLTDMVNKAGMTAAQATDYLASMGVDAEVVQTKTTAKDTHQYTGVKANIKNNPIKGNDPITGQPMEYNFPQVTYETVPVQGEDVKDNTAYSLKVTSANKSSGGGFKFSNANNGGGSAGAARRAPSGGSGKGKGGGNKGGGSGSGSQPDTSKKDKKKPLEDQRDIYHDINIELEDINRNLDRTQKKQERLYGKQLLDNLNKQTKILEQHKEKLKEKQVLQETDLKQQQEALSNLGVTFDQYGNIANYMDILGQKQNDINTLTKEENNLIEAYNKLTDKDAKKQLSDKISEKDKEVKNAEDDYKKLQTKIKNYDKLRDDMQDLVDQIEDETQKQVQINIKKFRMKVEITLEMGKAERDWNRFRREVLEHNNILTGTDFQNIYNNAIQNSRDIVSYFNVHGSIGSIQRLTDQLLETRGEIEKINQIGNSAIYGDNKAKAMSDLQNDLNELMGQLEDIQTLIDDIDKAYLETIEDVEKQFDEQIEDYEYIGDLIQHDINLMTLLYGDKNYDAMNNYYETLERNNLKQLDSLKQQRDFWKVQWEEATARGDTNAAKKFKENYKNTIKELNETIEQSAKTIQDKYMNTIDKIFDELDKKISNGKGTDYLSTEWQLMNKNADEYLDTINSAFAIQETERKYQKALDETKSIKNQQSLKKLMNQQLDILKNREKITQYDVDRAEKLLQIEQARIALEDAQSAKTSMRLKRDSQGNYSYEYVADNAAVGDAQANLAQAQNDLYNFDKERYRANLDDMLAAWRDFQAEYKEILKDTSLSDVERIERLSLLEQQYGEYINGKTEQNLHIRGNLRESAFADLAALYKTDVSNYNEMSNEQQQILMGTLVPAWESGIQKMSDKVAGQGGFIPSCEDAFDQVNIATQNYEQELGQMADAADVDLENVRNGVDNVAYSFENLVENNDNLIERMDTEISKITELKIQAEGLALKYKAVYDAAVLAASAIHKFLQEQSAAAAASQGSNDNSGGGGGSTTGSSTTQSSSSTTKSTPDSSGGSSGSGSSGSGGSGGSGATQTTTTTTTTTVIKKRGLGGGGTQPGSTNLMAAYETGGYTGAWHEKNGKIAILHEKELVLNQEDTKNILDSVKILRSISSLIQFDLFNRSNISGQNAFNNIASDQMEQNVHIEANFPNVDSKREIEEAFNDLVNLAAQRAMRR